MKPLAREAEFSCVKNSKPNSFQRFKVNPMPEIIWVIDVIRQQVFWFFLRLNWDPVVINGGVAALVFPRHFLNSGRVRCLSFYAR